MSTFSLAYGLCQPWVNLDWNITVKKICIPEISKIINKLNYFLLPLTFSDFSVCHSDL